MAGRVLLGVLEVVRSCKSLTGQYPVEDALNSGSPGVPWRRPDHGSTGLPDIVSRAARAGSARRPSSGPLPDAGEAHGPPQLPAGRALPTRQGQRLLEIALGLRRSAGLDQNVPL